MGETRRRRHTPSQRRRGLDCELGDFLLLGANVRWHLADIHPEAGHVRSWGVSAVEPMEVFLPSSSFGSSWYRLLLSPLAVQILAIDRRTISFEITRIASAGRSIRAGP